MMGTLPKGYPPGMASMGPKNASILSNQLISNSPSGSLSRPAGTLDSTNNSINAMENTTATRARFGSEASSGIQTSNNPYHPSPAHLSNVPGQHRGGMFPLSVGVTPKWDAMGDSGSTGIYGQAGPMGAQFESIPMRSMATLNEGEERRTMNSTTALSVASGSFLHSIGGGTGGGFHQPPWISSASSNAPPASKSVSALYAMLFVLIGVVLLFAKLFSSTGMRDLYIDIFAVYMFGFGFLACIYLCLVNIFARRQHLAAAQMNNSLLDQQTQPLYSGSNSNEEFTSGFGSLMDESNGSLFSNVALVAFFLLTFFHVVLVIIELLESDSRPACFTLVRVVVLIVQILFLIAQLLLVVLFSKLYIVTLSGLARICISHTIAADGFFWLLTITKESTESLLDHVSKQPGSVNTAANSDCFRQITSQPTSVVANLEERFSFILFTFATGYVLYCSCILYKMWNNCGKKTLAVRRKMASMHDSWAPKPNKRMFACNFKICEVICGFGVGIFALFSCLGVVVIDKVLGSHNSVQNVTLYYHVAVSVIWLAVLVFMSPIATCIIKGHPKRSRGAFNWMSEPVLAVTSLAGLAYSVFNSMSALLQLFNGKKLQLRSKAAFRDVNSAGAQRSEDDVAMDMEIVAGCLFALNVFRTVEIVLQSIYLSDAMKRQVVTAASASRFEEGASSEDDEEDLSWAERTSSSRVFVVLFLFINLALFVSELYEISHSAVMISEQVLFLGLVKWCIFSYFVGALSCLYRIHSVVCLLDVLRIVF